MRKYSLASLFAFIGAMLFSSFLMGQTPVKLAVGNIALSCAVSNNIIEVPITLANGADIRSLQWTLNFDPNSLRLVNQGTAMTAPFSGGTPSFNYIDSLAGQLRFSWFTSAGVMVGASPATVMKVKFRVIQPAVSSIEILENGTVPLEVASGSAILPYTLTAGQVTTDDLTPPAYLTCQGDTTVFSDMATPVFGLFSHPDDNCGVKKSEFVLSGASSGSGFIDASGSTFSLGQTTVTYTATDFSNNTATCAFSVTVVPADLRVLATSATPSCGEAFHIDVLTQNFDSLTTLGFTFEWNSAVSRLDSVTHLNASLPVSASDLGFFNASNGKLTFAWFSNDSRNKSLPFGARLFRVWMTATGSSGASTVVSFGDSPTPILAGTGAPQTTEVPVLTESGAIKIIDQTAPTITCPANITVTPAQLNQTNPLPHSIVPLLPTALGDNCGVAQINYALTGATGNSGVLAQNTVFQFNAGLTNVAFTAFDAALNATTCTFSVTVQPPVKVDFFIGSDSVACGGAFETVPVIVNGFQQIESFSLFIACNPAVATVSNAVNLAFSVGTWTINPQAGGISIAWTGPAQTLPTGATLFQLSMQSTGQGGANSAISFSVPPSATADFSGTDVPAETSGVNGSIKIFDKTAPVISGCPSDQVAFSSATSCDGTASWTAPTAIDNCSPTVSLTSNFAPGATFPAGAPTQVRYVAKDPSGNEITCAFLVYVIDATAPTIVCPQNLTVAPDSGLCTATLLNVAVPQVSDNCATNLLVTKDFLLPKMLNPGPTTLKYFVSDGGNSAQCSFTVTVAADPTIALSCPSDVTVACDDATFSTPQPTASVGCGPLTLTSKGALAAYPLGTSNVIFTAKNYRGDSLVCDFDITVIDIEKPTITACPVDLTIQTQGTDCSAVIPAITIPQSPKDNCTADDDLSFSFSPAPGAILAVGQHPITFSVTDLAGNVSTCAFQITVVKSLQPSLLNCPKDSTYSNVCSIQATWATPIPIGFCGAAPSLTSTPSGNSLQLTAGLPQTVTYTATGVNGQTATCSFTLTATDTTKPTVICPQNMTIDVAGNILVDPSNFLTGADNWPGCQSARVFFPAPTPADNCSGVVTQQFQGLLTSEPFPLGDTKVGFKYTDASGNTATCNFTITVEKLDTTAIIGSPNPACVGETVLLRADSLPNSTFQWSGPNSLNATTATVVLPSLTPATAGPYFVTATVNGCPAPTSLPFSLEFFAKPIALDDDTLTAMVMQTINYQVLTNDLLEPTADYSVIASSGGLKGTLVMAANGVLSYTSPATAVGFESFSYQVCQDDCPNLCDTALVKINVKGIPPCDIIPKVITPNGDGFNDQWIIFCIETGLVPNNELSVYNQWGDRVFQAAPYANNWEGTFDGKRLPDGTYFYIFKPDPSDPLQKPIKGFVTIFR